MLDEWMLELGDPAKAERFRHHVLGGLFWAGWILMWEAIGVAVFLGSLLAKERTDGQ